MRATPWQPRMLRRISRTASEQCWEWTGRRDRKGYGRFNVALNVTKFAHRLAWEIEFGPIPVGLCVLHRCDNPPCCNPAHLFLGTVADNNADMRSKGRQAVHERHHAARLTMDKAETARTRHAAGESCADLAREFGIHWTTMKEALAGLTWRRAA